MNENKDFLSKLKAAIGNGDDVSSLIEEEEKHQAELVEIERESAQRAREQQTKQTLAQLSFEIRTIKQYQGDQATYVMETELGNVSFGSIGELNSETKFRNAVAEQLRQSIPVFGRKSWPGIRDALVTLFEPVDLGPEAYSIERTRAALIEYLSSRWRNALPKNEAVLQEKFDAYERYGSASYGVFPAVLYWRGKYLIYLKYFLSLNAEQRGEDSAKDIRRNLRDLKVKSGVPVNVKRDDGTYTSTTYCEIPLAIARAPKK